MDQNLFDVLNRIDIKVKLAHKRAIVFVGKTKAGKSTSVNWVQSSKNLVGVANKKGDTHYQLVTQQGQQLAAIGNTLISCTLVPNIFDKNGHSVIDQAGYQDKRDYIGIVGVAYSLKAIFERVEEVKFVIVLPEDSISKNIDNLISTLINFFSMFKISEISDEIKKGIFDSTSFLITKCEKPEYINGCLEDFLEEISNENLKVQSNRKEIVNLVQHIKQSQKIGIFNKAKKDQNPQESNIFDTLDKNNWKFFNIKDAKTKPQFQSKKIIQFPFKKMYDDLSEGEQTQITTKIAHRQSSYERFCNILNESLNSQLEFPVINSITLDKTGFFKKLEQFVKENDHYKCQNLIDANKNTVITALPSKLNALKHVLDLFTAISEENLPQFNPLPKEINFMNNMSKFRIRFTKLLDILMKIFPTTVQQAAIIQKTGYILLRGIRQFEMLYDISPYHVNDASQKISSALEGVFKFKRQEIEQNYIKSFCITQADNVSFNLDIQKSRIEKYFVSEAEVKDLQAFLVGFKSRKPEAFAEYYPLARQIKLILAKFSFNSNAQGKFKIAGNCLFQAFQRQCQLEGLAITQYKANANPTPEIVAQFQSKMKNHFIKRQQILKLLQRALIETNKFKAALEVAKMNHEVYSVEDIFEKMLYDKHFTLDQRKQLLLDYADFCYNHYKIEKAVEILEQLLTLQNHTFQKKIELNNKIIHYIMNEEESKTKYKNYLSTYKVVDAEDASVKSLIEVVKTQLQI